MSCLTLIQFQRLNDDQSRRESETSKGITLGRCMRRGYRHEEIPKKKEVHCIDSPRTKQRPANKKGGSISGFPTHLSFILLFSYSWMLIVRKQYHWTGWLERKFNYDNSLRWSSDTKQIQIDLQNNENTTGKISLNQYSSLEIPRVQFRRIRTDNIKDSSCTKVARSLAPSRCWYFLMARHTSEWNAYCEVEAGSRLLVTICEEDQTESETRSEKSRDDWSAVLLYKWNHTALITPRRGPFTIRVTKLTSSTDQSYVALVCASRLYKHTHRITKKNIIMSSDKLYGQ